MGKKLAIIGAGIAGLSAGVYGRLNGFDTEIYEMHTIPGGECTGWSRKGYYFDGCIHWLLGSKPGTDMNKVWRDVGALDDNIEIIHHEYFFCHEQDGQTVFLYRDPDKLEQHLLEASPEDGSLIRQLCQGIKGMQTLTMPTKKPMDQMNILDMGQMMMSMAPAMRSLGYFEKISLSDYAAQYKSPVLRNALVQLVPGFHKATSLVTTLASMSTGDSGWPTGGSLAFAKRIEQRYLELGGKVSYRSPVSKVLIEQGKTKGIELTDGRQVSADYVISTADAHWTLYDLLEGKYLDEQWKTLYNDRDAYPTYITVQVSLGIACDLYHYPHTISTHPDRPVDAGGVSNEFVGLRHFCFDKTLMPEGRSAVTVVMSADYEWWKAKRQDPVAYKQEKERLAQEIIAIVEQRYPETKGKIEVHDVATPMTYERYCNAWRGSWMAWAGTPKSKIRYVSGKLPGLEGFFYAGQWNMPPGGLPTAVVGGKWVIQRICGLERKKFQHR